LFWTINIVYLHYYLSKHIYLKKIKNKIVSRKYRRSKKTIIIKRMKMDIIDKSSINHNNLGLLFVESLKTTSRSEGHLVGYYFLLFNFQFNFFIFFYLSLFFFNYFFLFLFNFHGVWMWTTYMYIHIHTSSIKIHNSISFTHCGLQINHQMPLLRRHRQGSVGL
jgi:hypothetical protein